jgi:hypothetical protein
LQRIFTAYTDTLSVLSPKNGDCMEEDVGDVNQAGESVSDARDF